MRVPTDRGHGGPLRRTAMATAVVLAWLASYGAASSWAAVDLSVSETASASTVATGDLLTYTVAVANNGADPANNVDVKDRIRSDLAFDSASSGCALDQSTVRCAVGTLAPAGSATVEIRVRPVSPGSVTNTASANASGADANEADNSASTTVTVLGRSNLTLSLKDSPDPVFLGRTLKYALTVLNRGPDRATGIVVSDQLPSGVQLVNPGKGCSASGTTVSCPVARLGSGRRTTRTITVRPQHTGAISTSATVSLSGSEVDSDASNNAATATTNVVKKQAAPLPVTCLGRPATIVDPAGAGPGTVAGTPGRDVIATLGGDDTVRSGGGNDLVCAGAGEDSVFAGSGDDRVLGGLGPDRLSGVFGSDALLGGGGADSLGGGGGRDRLDGGTGPDRCLGGPGVDRQLRC